MRPARRAAISETRRFYDPGDAVTLPCPACGEDLLVSVSETLVLTCACGRRISNEELRLPDLFAGLESLLAAWEEKVASLKALSVDARSRGSEIIVRVVDQNLKPLEIRIQLLRDIVRPLD